MAATFTLPGHPARISNVMRAVAGSWGAFCAYAASMIHLDRPRGTLEALLNPALDPTLFQFVWLTVSIAMLAVVVTGRDWVARVGFGSLGVGMAMGMASALIDVVPWDRQWFVFGMMAVTFVQCIIVLWSPMRLPPKHLYRMAHPGG